MEFMKKQKFHIFKKWFIKICLNFENIDNFLHHILIKAYISNLSLKMIKFHKKELFNFFYGNKKKLKKK